MRGLTGLEMKQICLMIPRVSHVAARCSTQRKFQSKSSLTISTPFLIMRAPTVASMTRRKWYVVSIRIVVSGFAMGKACQTMAVI